MRHRSCPVAEAARGPRATARAVRPAAPSHADRRARPARAAAVAGARRAAAHRPDRRRRCRTARPPGRSTGARGDRRRSGVAAVGAHPRAPGSVRRCSARRSSPTSRGLGGERARPAGGRRRVRGQRRPAHAHVAGRRPAGLVGAGGRCRSGRSRLLTAGAHDRRGALRRLVGPPAPCSPDGAGDDGLRWYLRRAKDGYLPENASYSEDQRLAHGDRRGCPDRGGTRSSATSGSRRDGRGHRRVLRRGAVHARSCGPVLPERGDDAYLLPSVATLLFGGWLYTPRRGLPRGRGRRDAVRADAHRPGRPRRHDPRRAPGRRRRRSPGCWGSPTSPTTGRRRGASAGREVEAQDVRYSYVEGRDVLHGVDLDSGSASGSRWSAPRAPASRPSAGCSPGSTRRGPARSRSAAWG